MKTPLALTFLMAFVVCCESANVRTFIFEGDSITDGTVNGNGAKLWQVVSNFYFLTNRSITEVATSGDKLADIVSDYASEVQPLAPGSGTNAYLWVMIGVNDTANWGTNTESWFENTISNYWKTARADGFRVIASTITEVHLDEPDGEIARTNLNAWIRGASNVWDFLVDSQLILPDQQDVGDYISAGVHPTDLGIRKIATNLNAVLISNYWETGRYCIDVDASGGANTGTNWANAWTNWTGAAVELASMPDDSVIEISGGTYGSAPGTNRCEVDGTSFTDGHPLIVRSSREEGHTDKITWYGRFVLWAGHDNFIFDGSKSDAHSITNAASTTNLTNNINWTIRCSGDYNASDGESIFHMPGDGDKNVTIRWIEMDGWDYVGGHTSSNDLNCGVWLAGNEFSNIIIEYCDIHNIGQDGITGNNGTKTLGDLTVRYCYVHETGDDGVEFSGGARIYGNRIERTTGRNGHPDAIQCPDDQWEIFNNIIGDYNTGQIYNGFRHTNETHFWVWNNLIYTRLTNCTQAGLQIVVDQTLFPTNLATEIWNDLLFANNTIYRTVGGFSFYNRYSGTLAVTISNCIIANNLVIDPLGRGMSFKGYDGTGISFENVDVVVSNNIVTGTHYMAKQVDYKNAGDEYATIEAFQTAQGFTGNSSSRPLFVDLSDWDLRLATNDTVALGAGANLTSLGITNDLESFLRAESGAWDIGAYSVSSAEGGVSGPAIWLEFEDVMTDGQSDDSSGYAAHMLRYGYAATPTNWPSQVTATNGGGSYGASFRGKLNLYPPGNEDDFWDGDYGAITNVGTLTTATQLTVMAWVYFDPADTYHQATILDCGYGTNGAWHFGRYYSTTYGEPQFNVVTNSDGGAGDSARAGWPQTVNSFWYTNAAWHHLAAVADLSTPTTLSVALYWNGTNCLSTNHALATGIPHFTITDAPGSSYGPWISVGCNTHNGTPTLDDAGYLPNNGWLDGILDDVRIYSRALTADEILAIAGTEPGEPSPPSTNTLQKVTLRGAKVTARGGVTFR